VWVAMGDKITPPSSCQYESCSGLAQYQLEYVEDGTPKRTKWVCREHKNTEKIHDPVGINVVIRPHEIVDPRKVQQGDDE